MTLKLAEEVASSILNQELGVFVSCRKGPKIKGYTNPNEYQVEVSWTFFDETTLKYLMDIARPFLFRICTREHFDGSVYFIIK